MDTGTVERLTENFGVWFYAIPILVFIIINADKIKEIILIFERGHENRLKAINDYLSKNETDISMRNAFIETRDRMSFQKVYGVNREKEFRHAYLHLLNEVEEKIPPRLLSHASRYMFEYDGVIEIKISRGALIEYYWNHFSVLFFIGSSIYISALNTMSINSLPLVMSLIFLCFGLFSTKELSPVHTAKNLQRLREGMPTKWL